MAPQDFPMQSSDKNGERTESIKETSFVEAIQKKKNDSYGEEEKLEGHLKSLDEAALKLLSGPYVWGCSFTLKSSQQVVVYNKKTSYVLSLEKDKISCQVQDSIWAK